MKEKKKSSEEKGNLGSKLTVAVPYILRSPVSLEKDQSDHGSQEHPPEDKGEGRKRSV